MKIINLISENTRCGYFLFRLIPILIGLLISSSAMAHDHLAKSILPAVIMLLSDDEPKKVCEKTSDAPDFNGDGCADLAVGAPHSGFPGGSRQGQINVFYGVEGGLASSQHQIITLDGMYDHQGNQIGDLLGDASSQDLFGSALATGDFNNDGFTDLAVGVSLENVGSVVNPGAVHVIYGSPGGLSANNNQLWHQGGGYVDANGDGVGSFLGDIWGGLEDNDRFGQTIAVGNFDGDEYDDLAIGVPNEDIGSIENAGAVNILSGSNTGLTFRGNEGWHQNGAEKLATGMTGYVSLGDILGGAEASDFFGEALAVGNFNGDAYDDLAIGAFGEDIAGVNDTGAFNLVHGSITGLRTQNNHHWFQGVDPQLDTNGDGVADQTLPRIGTLISDAGDRFADTLVAGDFNNDGYDDLAVGVPFEDLPDHRHQSLGTIAQTGLIVVMNGTEQSLDTNVVQFIVQDSIHNVSDLPGGVGILEAGEQLGEVISVGNINGDSFDDLIIGIPNESDDVLSGSVGAAMVVYGSGSRLVSNGAQYFSPVQSYTQNNTPLADLIGEAGGGFKFGAAVSGVDLNGDGHDELVIGTSRYETPFSNDEVGSIHVFFGSKQGAKVSNHQFWTPLGGSTGNPTSPTSLGSLWGITLGEKRFGSAFP